MSATRENPCPGLGNTENSSAVQLIRANLAEGQTITSVRQDPRRVGASNPQLRLRKEGFGRFAIFGASFKLEQPPKYILKLFRILQLYFRERVMVKREGDFGCRQSRERMKGFNAPLRSNSTYVVAFVPFRNL